MADEQGRRGAYGIRIGTYEDGLQQVGRPTEVRFADAPVNTAMGRQFAAAVRDPNPMWWDDALARRVAGSPVVPPATLVAWLTPIDWRPDGTGGPGNALLTSVPLPGDSMINVSSEIEFFDHLREGDWLNIVEEVESISEEKHTGAGRGHFLTVVARFRRQDGSLVALQRNVMLRFWAGTREES